MTSDSNQIKNYGAKFWDSNPCGGNWNTYREFMDWYRHTEPYIFNILDGYDWRKKKVVEIGCGQGIMINYLACKGIDMIGMDMSFQSIQGSQVGGKELNQNNLLHLFQADAEQLPIADGVFDVVISCGVLHHTSDTNGAINNIFRILKPGGTAIVMLYRSGNPKWWMTSLLRAYSRLVNFMTKRPDVLSESIRAKQQTNSASGTALLELFGVPILKAFSNKQARGFFKDFSEVKVTNHQPGFRRLVDIMPILSGFSKLFSWLDRNTIKTWGFYQVIEARK